jgi:hypothetical protein
VLDVEGISDAAGLVAPVAAAAAGAAGSMTATQATAAKRAAARPTCPRSRVILSWRRIAAI